MLPPFAGGSGECCIFNEYGGGGCGPCNRGAGPELQFDVSDLATATGSDKQHIIHHLFHIIGNPVTLPA